MPMEPPPRIVNKFEKIWRDWLFFFWQFVFKHTGGSIPTPPATGTSWNAHGNTATGDGTAGNPLNIVDGAFLISGTTGATPTDIGSPGTYFSWIPAKGALRVGRVIDTSWVDAKIGPDTIAMGPDSKSEGQFSVAIGNTAECVGLFPVNSLAIGSGCLCASISSAAIGFGCESHGTQQLALGFLAICSDPSGFTNSQATAIGANVEAAAGGAVVIGTGADATPNNFINRVPNSVMLGARINNNGGTDKATLTLSNGKCGIENEAPLSTLDVGGSVGFAYNNITAANGTTTLVASDTEYTFRIDVSLGNKHTIVLPLLSTVDRRVYYFKVTNIGGGALGGADILTIKTNAANQIEDVAAGQGRRFSAAASSSTGIPITSGQAILLFGNGTDGTWWAQ